MACSVRAGYLEPAIAGGTKTLASLNVIDKKLADVGKHHDTLGETCLKDTIDGKASLECCRVIDDSLVKATAEQDKLMKRLADHHRATK